MIGSQVYISIGSNMGHRAENLNRAVRVLNDAGHIRVAGVSGYYETQPVDFIDQAWFVNAAVKLETTLPPFGLLDFLSGIEKEMGQEGKAVRYGPRTIDLDIIYYDEMVIKSEMLTIPHPRMHKRCFVLKPLCDIGKDKVHPVYKLTTAELLEKLDDVENQRVIPREKESKVEILY